MELAFFSCGSLGRGKSEPASTTDAHQKATPPLYIRIDGSKVQVLMKWQLYLGKMVIGGAKIYRVLGIHSL